MVKGKQRDKMYRVMVVDDEAAHRKGMIRLLNRMKPDYFLLEARDGNTAELILDTVDMDIILTDIRMPNKDGLEFLADLHRANHSAKVIIVSGYGQFSYAKAALANGAFDFLLKPIDPSELSDTLERAEKSVEEERKRQQHQRRYMDLLLVKMIKSSLSKEEEEQLNGVLPREGSGLVLTIKKRDGEREKTDFIGLHQKVKQALDGWGHTILFEMDEDTVSWAGLIFLRRKYTEEERPEALAGMKACIRQVLPEETDFGMSGIADNLYAGVREGYRQSAAALTRTFYLNGEGSIYDDGIFGSEQQVLVLLTEKEDELANLIRYGDHDAIKQQLTTLFEQLPAASLPNPNRLKELFVLLGMRTVKLLQNKGMISEYHPAIAAFTKEIMDAKSIRRLQSEVENLFLILNDISRQGAQKEDVILLSVRYLEEHYGEDIALTEVAEKFFFTPTYYSIYFKKKTGKPFSQYLKELRMERACAMLCESNKKVGEVAQDTGYSDSAYFGKVFKKYVGCSPEEYRKRNYRI